MMKEVLMFVKRGLIPGMVAGLLILLSACSGGGGGGGSAPSPAPSQPTTPPPSTGTPAPAPTPEPDYILDSFFPNKTFTGMRSSIHTAVEGPALERPMLDCTILVTEQTLCSFNDLPLLGMTHSDPTIDDIMARVLVSHDWMAVRFREVLQEMPPEVRLITRGITAIVISHDIRPSFYWQGTGAIYLDPSRLWLSQAEFDTIDTTPDFRADLGNVFQFTMPGRYVTPEEVDVR
ncbi:MAG: hypothetical protein KDI36_20300, partial [Pseudomonadales bacterium]|nr:hypothetical protein [Pseudomonadales bacterium]